MFKHASWIAFLALALSCAGAPKPGVTTATDWVRVTSPHFTVQTDESPENARKMIRYLEQIRGGLLAAAWPHAKLTRQDHVDVVVLGDDLAFEQLFGRNVDGIFLGAGRSSLIVLHGNPDHWEHRVTLAAEGSTSLLKHELVHRMSAALGVRQPRWLAEGLAQFLETIQLAPDGKTAQLGMVNLVGLRMYKSFRSVGVADALAWQGALDKYNEAETAARYGVSWALVHWMFNAHPQAFARYQLASIKGASAEEAWTVAFPNLTPAQADTELFQYISHGGYNVFTAQLPPASKVAPKEEALRSSDVHALEARLMFAAGASREEGRAERLTAAREELAKALVEEPANLAALELTFGSAKPAERAAIAKKATEAHPESSLAWMMLGQSMGDTNSPEQQQAFLKAAALSPEDPEPLNALAWERATHGQAAQALPYALKAVNLAPADPAVLDTLAATYAGVGRCQDALATEHRAIGFLPDRASAATAQGYRDRLEQFQKVCAGKQVPAPANAPTPAPAQAK